MSPNSSSRAGDDNEFVDELGGKVGGVDCRVNFGVESWLNHWAVIKGSTASSPFRDQRSTDLGKMLVDG